MARSFRTLTDPNDSVLHLLHRAGQVGDALMARELERAGMTPRQFVILQAVSRWPGCRQREIEMATGVDRSTVTDILARLEDRGAVRREADQEDRRARTARLTDEGRRLLRRCRDRAAEAERKLLALLPAAERRTFRAALEVMCGTQRPEGARQPARRGGKSAP